MSFKANEEREMFEVLIDELEKEFKQIQPRKTRKGDRLFRVQDIELLKQIYWTCFQSIKRFV